jgi:glycosyltransferase involved in cell wall biosynthesis
MLLPSAPRILWLTEEFYPPTLGGAELMASYLTTGLAERELRTQVVTRQTEPPSAACEQVGRVRVRRVHPAGTIKGQGIIVLPRVVGYLLRLGLILLREARDYDVVFVSGMKIIPLVAVPLTRLLGKKCFIRVESTFEIHEPVSAQSLRSMSRSVATFLSRMTHGLQRRMLASSDRVIAISGEVNELLRRVGVAPGRIACIPNAVDLEQFRPVSRAAKAQLRSRLNLPAERTVVLFAARLSRAKGILLLIDAWPELIRRRPDLHLVIVGSGQGSFDDCESELAERIRTQGLSAHTQMVGAVTNVHEYLQACDLAVFPSEYEGFGLGIIEALGCGIPLAVTPVGVARDLIVDGENGFLFAINDRSGLIATVGTMLEQSARWPEIGRRARETVGPYGLTAVLDRYVALCTS